MSELLEKPLNIKLWWTIQNHDYCGNLPFKKNSVAKLTLYLYIGLVVSGITNYKVTGSIHDSLIKQKFKWVRYTAMCTQLLEDDSLGAYWKSEDLIKSI